MNGHRHWTDEELIGRLYGLGESGGTACPECEARLAELEQRRMAVRQAPASNARWEERLRRQRQAVWARVENPRRSWLWKLAPAGAMALMVVVGVALHAPAPVAPVTQVAMASDAQFFNEIASMVNEDGPRTTETMKGLFPESGEAQ